MARGSGDERVIEQLQAERLLTEPAGERTRARCEAGTPGLMIPPAWEWVAIACEP